MKVKLPVELGGVEGEVIQERPDGFPTFSAVRVGGLTVLVPAVHLAEVAPPLPEEPRYFSTVRVGVRAYVRDDVPTTGEPSWHGPEGRLSWAELCRKAQKDTGFPPALLVDAPVPVELPWVTSHDEVSVDAERVVRVFQSKCKVTRDQALAMAAALITSAGGA